MEVASKQETQIGPQEPPTRVLRARKSLPGRFALRPAPDGGEATGTEDPFYAACKRALDIVGALLLLALGLPLMLLLALLVVATSPGPALFRQTRLGRGGVPFSLLKFRTMVRDAEGQLASRPELWQAYEQSYKLPNDPRITPLGRFLRRTSLDELPQLLNIVGGSMSLIGPRPIVPKELEKYGADAPKLLTVKPGLGGNWQAHGRSETTYAERVALDMDYIDRRCLTLDLVLLGKTALSVCRRRGSV